MSAMYPGVVQSCPHGCTDEDLRQMFPGPELQKFWEWMFWEWMSGQTMTICDGRAWDYAHAVYKPSACAGHPHGLVVYPWDVNQFLRNLPVID